MANCDFDLEETIALLERTPMVLSSLTRGLPEAWIRCNEGAHTMNVYEILGHLIYGEIADWIPRARVILEHGETGTFAPFDRWGYKKEMEGKSLNWLLDEFAGRRRRSLEDLRGLGLQSQDFEKQARHPALGQVTLRQLLSTWAAHDLTHLHQISRVMANRYRKAVGPWAEYLGVLQCNGHSAP